MKRSMMLVFVLAACGDNLKPHQGPDAGPQPADAHQVLPRAVAVSGDFMATGIVSMLDVAKLSMTQNVAPGAASSDPFVRVFDGKLYIVNRAGGNNVTILDGKTMALVDQISSGASSNPQDVAVVGSKLYVPALGTAGVVVLTRGSADLHTIDLATPLGDPDGKPDCVSAYAVGTQVFVACGMLDGNFVPRTVGKVAVIDTATDTVTSMLDLPYKNPQNMFVKTPDDSVFLGDLLIPTIPDFQDYSIGCLARVSTGATPSAGCAITNQQAGGFETHVDVQAEADGEMLWLAVGTYDQNFVPSGRLRGFDLKTGSLWATPLTPDTQLIVDVAACPDSSIVVADQTKNAAGLRVYANSTERTTMPLPIGLPPAFGNNLVCFDAN